MARLRWNYVSEIHRVCKKNSLQSHLICLIFLLKLSEIALCIVYWSLGVDPLFLEPDCYIIRLLRFII